MVLRFNRSPVLNFSELDSKQQAHVIEGMDTEEIEEAENDSFVILKFSDGEGIRPLSDFMRTDGGRFHGIAGVCNTAAYGIILSKCGTEAIVALIG